MRGEGFRSFELSMGEPRMLRLAAELAVVIVARGACRARVPDAAGPLDATSGSVIVTSESLSLERATSEDATLVCFSVGAHFVGAPISRTIVLSASELARDARLAALRDLLLAGARSAIARRLTEAFLLSVREERPARETGTSDRAVLRALELMRAELCRPWTVSRLARAVGLSRAAFARRFRAAVGQPPERHLIELRLERAAELLATTNEGLAWIAAQIGYGSEFAFSRAFKRCRGISPSVYRRRCRSIATSSPPLCLAA